MSLALLAPASRLHPRAHATPLTPPRALGARGRRRQPVTRPVGPGLDTVDPPPQRAGEPAPPGTTGGSPPEAPPATRRAACRAGSKQRWLFWRKSFERGIPSEVPSSSPRARPPPQRAAPPPRVPAPPTRRARRSRFPPKRGEAAAATTTTATTAATMAAAAPSSALPPSEQTGARAPSPTLSGRPKKGDSMERALWSSRSDGRFVSRAIVGVSSSRHSTSPSARSRTPPRGRGQLRMSMMSICERWWSREKGKEPRTTTTTTTTVHRRSRPSGARPLGRALAPLGGWLAREDGGARLRLRLRLRLRRRCFSSLSSRSPTSPASRTPRTRSAAARADPRARRRRRPRPTRRGRCFGWPSSASSRCATRRARR